MSYNWMTLAQLVESGLRIEWAVGILVLAIAVFVVVAALRYYFRTLTVRR